MRTVLRLFAQLGIALLVLSGPLAAAWAEAAPYDPVLGAAEIAIADGLNRARAEAGLQPITADPGLAEVARRHSARMRDAGRVFHNTQIEMEVPRPWAEVAENVGRGPSPAAVERMFLTSRQHRAYILGDFDRIGVGIAVSGRVVYATQVFVRNAA
jgi:uncharacterized protein YkwD